MRSIVVQAGGESRRMGQDKALLPFLGRPLIQRVIEHVAPLADEVLVTTNHPENYGFLNLPLVSDAIPGRGALGGLYTALSAASQPYVAVLACDMPFVNSSLLAAQFDLLISNDVDIVIPRSGEGLEPFHAVYRRETCLQPVKTALEADKWRVDSWFSMVKVRIMDEAEILRHDPRLRSFWNANTPEEFETAARLAQEPDNLGLYP
jgi:molybdopterin-guanine dinucleotide biosynthesis protein A